MEHAVYVCSWRRTDTGYEFWVVARPNWRGAGLTIAEAEESLQDAILSGGGAIQAVMEFVPPLPKAAAELEFTVPDLLEIVGDGQFETDFPRNGSDGDRLTWESRFFEGPICKSCGAVSARRTEVRLTLEAIDGGFDGHFGRVGRECSATVYLFSEQFLDLLTTAERDFLILRPTTRLGRHRKRFHELVGPCGVPMIAVSGLPISGWRCGECGYRAWGYWLKEFDIHQFIARQDIPDPLPDLLTIGTPPELSLCMTARRWQQLVGRSGTRGMISRQIGVVDDDRVVREPELPVRC